VPSRAAAASRPRATSCLATESAQFGYPEVQRGFVPALVMNLLKRAVGEKVAFDLAPPAACSRRAKPLPWGSFRGCTRTRTSRAAAEVLRELATASGSALAFTKQQFLRARRVTFEDGIRSRGRQRGQSHHAGLPGRALGLPQEVSGPAGENARGRSPQAARPDLAARWWRHPQAEDRRPSKTKAAVRPRAAAAQLEALARRVDPRVLRALGLNVITAGAEPQVFTPDELGASLRSRSTSPRRGSGPSAIPRHACPCRCSNPHGR